MMRAAAGGAAVIGGGAVLGSGGERSLPPLVQARQVAVRAALQRAGLPTDGDGLPPVVAAVVSAGRSWDSQVHLALADGRSGLCAPDARGFALAVAAQAVGRPVQVRCWGHQPEAEGGVGRFAGVLFALDAIDLGADLPAAEVQS
jgi:hypothetical protein